uniref:Retrotransposon protein, putative, Ty1-copia subclass n=1 Tax=Tanacetum cinerariifolium TaxID=118510 RepID=A0A6L2M5A3_TANCI|nr:retrotransposon protein, putative, Ty1-copia subclass [Tanacetum cinerariifolium]
MTGAKFDIEKFNGTGDFGLWRIKMRALLIQHGCKAALEVLPVDMEAQTKAELNKKAHSAVILYIDEFNKIVLDLANIEVKFKDEDLALLLLTSLPASYEYFVDTLLYGREDLTLKDVMATLNSKEIKERSKAKRDDGEGLYVRGRTDRRDSRQSRGKSRSKYQVYSWVTTWSERSESGKVKVINGSMVILSGIRRDNCVYSLDGHAMAGELNASVEEKDSLAQVWHKRLGRISEVELQVLEKQGLFGKKSLANLDFCENYVLGKSHRVSFDVGRHTTQGVIDYVHSDLWGPSQVESLGGKMYFLSIIDDDSRRSGLPKTFWAEATCTVAYLHNRSPSRAIEKKTPMKMWSGHPSDYGILRIFGCVLYPHDKQGKLEPRVVKCVLLGNPEGVKGYRLYRLDDESPKIVTSRNVVFNESVMYKDTLKDFGAGNKFVEELQVACEDSSKWKAAMKEEMDSLRKNKTWELIDHPAGQKLVVLALSAYKDYELEQLDVKTAYLHGNLEEVIYMKQPPGYEQGNKVCLLKKSLYGLKQSPRQWSYVPGEYIYLLLYVDDMLIACKSKAEIGSTKSLLKKEFDMKELREAKKIIDNGKSVKMPLGGHFKLSLKDFSIRDCDVERMSKVSYANGIGSLMYLMVCTRPNIAYVAEYMALTEAVKEAIWLRGLLEELGVELNTVAVNCDNQGAIHLSRNHVFHKRTKHINRSRILDRSKAVRSLRIMIRAVA